MSDLYQRKEDSEENFAQRYVRHASYVARLMRSTGSPDDVASPGYFATNLVLRLFA